MKFRLLISILILLSLSSSGQVALGEWRSHLPAQSFQFISELESSVFAANSSGVLIFDKQEESTQHLTKINSLVDEGISAFSCSKNFKSCVVGYENGNIDIITDNYRVINQPALKNNFIVGDKRINDILFIDEGALLSTGIGVILLDLETYNFNADRKLEFNNERVQIFKSTLFNDTLFLASDLGMFKTEYSGLFENSELIEIEIPVPSSYINQVYQIKSSLYATYKSDTIYFGDTLYKYEQGAFNKEPRLAGEGLVYVESRNDTILVTHPDRVAIYDSQFNEIGSIFTFGGETPGLQLTQARFGTGKKILIADNAQGAAISSFENQFNPTILRISSPSSQQTSVITQIQNKLYAFPGGNEFTFNSPIIHVLEDETWSSKVLQNSAVSTTRNTNGCAIIDDTAYVSTDKVGIIQLDEKNEIIKLFDYTNSTIQDAQPNSNYDYVGITDITSSEDGTLYALNNQVPSPLIIRHTDGNWESISFLELSSPKTGDIITTPNGFVVLLITDVGIIIYDTKDTHDDTSDDEYKLLTSSPSGGNLPSGTVTCFAVDKENELWVGTDAGIGVIYSLESVFNDGFDGAQKIIVNQGGFNGYLFETETVEAIAVDGADRKWIGTASSGLFLISSDGQEQLQNFNSSNSPLLTNKVTDLAILPKTGELFIASEKGLISYRPDATEPNSELTEIISYPNPVKPGYDGNIAIKNLTNNSYVRITNNAGRLIFETQSLGGQAVWDGKNMSGQKVPSGVYLVFATTREGTGGQVGKILILQ